MSHQKLYETWLERRRKGEKQFIVLIDPDKTKGNALERTVRLAEEAGVDGLFVGGSLLVNDALDPCLQLIREYSRLPVILFPGSTYQVNNRADAILFLSLISGRNPDLLIGQQMIAAPYLRASKLEIVSTGYLLIDGGVVTTVSYMSNTQPIPANKPEIAGCTAMAGAMMGFKLIYLDAGSGARQPVPVEMISVVRRGIDVPLVVGGGIRRPERALSSVRAGADLIVVGNAIEQEPGLMAEMAAAIHSYRPGESLKVNAS